MFIIKEEELNYFSCEKILVKPFNLVINDEQYEKIRTFLIEKTEQTEDKLIDLIEKELKLKYNKRRSSRTTKFMTLINTNCQDCMKRWVCPKMNEIKEIARYYPDTALGRKLLDCLNFEKKEIVFLTEKTETIEKSLKEEEEKKTKIKQLYQKNFKIDLEWIKKELKENKKKGDEKKWDF